MQRQIYCVAYAVFLWGSSTAAATLELYDLDADLTTAEVYYDATLDLSWLADSNIGLTETFGLERGAITDYGREIDSKWAVWLSEPL